MTPVRQRHVALTWLVPVSLVLLVLVAVLVVPRVPGRWSLGRFLVLAPVLALWGGCFPAAHRAALVVDVDELQVGVPVVRPPSTRRLAVPSTPGSAMETTPVWAFPVRDVEQVPTSARGPAPGHRLAGGVQGLRHDRGDHRRQHPPDARCRSTSTAWTGRRAPTSPSDRRFLGPGPDRRVAA